MVVSQHSWISIGTSGWMGRPRWSPSGNEIYFYGVRKREAEKPGGWWIVSLDGGNSRRLRLPGVEEGHEDFADVHAWTRTKDDREWIVYSISNQRC